MDTHEQSQKLRTALTHNFDDLFFVADLSYNTDNKYSPPLSGRYYSGYFYLEQGGLIWNRDSFELSIGRLNPIPMIDSPYSLFINSNDHSTITGNFYLESEHFFFRSQWLQLNQNSAAEELPSYNEGGDNYGFSSGYPDRGASIRYYGIQIGDVRFGLQDAAIFTGRSFDVEYLVNPLPSIFLQYVNNSDGTPWKHNEDENAIIGFFFDYTRPEYYVYSQVLLDDINVHMFFDKSKDNPNKLAWTFGGTKETAFGEIGFHHAGATKYVYQPTSNDAPYGYTYYPDTLFLLDNNDEAAIPIEDNYIGYKYGENNLAFLLSYVPELSHFDAAGSLEFVVSGSKSPVNPWGPYTEYEQGGKFTKMFTDSPLMKRLNINIDAKKQISNNFSVYGHIELGYEWNHLKLTTGLSGSYKTEYEDANEGSDEEYDLEYLKYYEPSNESEPIAKITLGVQYSYDPFSEMK
ncbi:MAG: hypothetical protein K9L66_06605 [Spirochaetaceae bacterium]|nr:hypothetical protein [Spirochaetaceae bacterium]